MHKKGDKSCSPDEKCKRLHENNLFEKKRWQRQGDHLVSTGIVDPLNCWPVVVNFPNDIWKHQESCDDSSQPDPARKKQLPLFCHHEADDKSEAEKEDADLVFESQSQNKSKPN